MYGLNLHHRVYENVERFCQNNRIEYRWDGQPPDRGQEGGMLFHTREDRDKAARFARQVERSYD